MDHILQFLDDSLLDKVYGDLPRDNLIRQIISIFCIFTFGGQLMYLVFASFSYYFVFDKNYRKHKLFLKNQEILEIKCALYNIPGMAVLTTPLILGELYGYSKLHDGLGEWGFFGLALNVVWFIVFTDAIIYLVHRGMHHPTIYGPVHKLHHKWKVPTPFASHAFGAIDGFLQGVAYHVYVYLFPMNKFAYLGMFLFVNFWTVSIHDGSYFLGGTIINTARHHTDHHLYFNYNYGQYFTFWDKLGGSHFDPMNPDKPKDKEE